LRHFEFVGEDSSRKSNQASKFWEISREDAKLTIRFGPIGANGQKTIKTFSSPEEAIQAEVKAIAEKIKKGYVERPEAQRKVLPSNPVTSTLPKPGTKKSGKNPVPVPAEAGPQRAKFCSNCGQELPATFSNFCSQCGEKLVEIPLAPSEDLVNDERFFKALVCCFDTSWGSTSEVEEVIIFALSNRGMSRSLFDEVQTWWLEPENAFFAELEQSVANFLKFKGSDAATLRVAVSAFANPSFRDAFAACIKNRYEAGKGSGARNFRGALEFDTWVGSKSSRSREAFLQYLTEYFKKDEVDKVCEQFLSSAAGLDILRRFDDPVLPPDSSSREPEDASVSEKRPDNQRGTNPLLGVFQEWLDEFGFEKYVGSGYESELAGTDKFHIWTEIHDGMNGDFVRNDYSPPDEHDVPQGYYVMKKSWAGFEEGAITLSTSTYEDCESCDFDDPSCEECDGEGLVFVDLADLAKYENTG
jgi:predicted DNA-binding WGR domain protein